MMSADDLRHGHHMATRTKMTHSTEMQACQDMPATQTHSAYCTTEDTISPSGEVQEHPLNCPDEEKAKKKKKSSPPPEKEPKSSKYATSASVAELKKSHEASIKDLQDSHAAQIA